MITAALGGVLATSSAAYGGKSFQTEPETESAAGQQPYTLSKSDREAFQPISQSFKKIMDLVDKLSIARPDTVALGKEMLLSIGSEMDIFIPVTGSMGKDDIIEIFSMLPQAAAMGGKIQGKLREVSVRAVDLMVHKIDRHSDYITPQEHNAWEESRATKYTGTGIIYRKKVLENAESPHYGNIEILSLESGGPADKAGLQPRDIVTHIDGVSVLNYSKGDIRKNVRGEKGTDVVFTVEREGLAAPFDVTITRDVIHKHWVSARLIEGQVAYIKIDSFKDGIAKEVKDYIKDFQKQSPQPLKGYIIDLRGNGGGLVKEAIDLVDLFLDEGQIHVRQGRDGKNDDLIKAKRGDIANGAPLIVMTDGGSASASELTASALQDNGRAKVVGANSFGKGVIQTYYDLPDGGKLKLTTDYFIAPSGDAIQWTGVVPDIDVEGVKRPRYSREKYHKGSVKPLNTGIRRTFQIQAVCSPAENITYDFTKAGDYLQDGKMDFDLACAYDAVGNKSPYIVTVPVKTNLALSPVG